MVKILLGLDIGTQMIKMVQISREGNTNQLLAAGYIATPPNVLTSTNPADEQALANIINRLAHDMKASTVHVSAALSTSKVITRVIEIPLISESELESSIKWEAEQYIPLPISRVKIDYAVISTDQEKLKMKILLVAAPISIVERYMRIVTLAGLTLDSLETEILAAGRSISVSYPNLENVLIFSMGATTSEIALVHNKVIVYTKSYPIGGNTLTHAIAQELGFEPAQAEEYKKTYGLDETQLEGKIAKTITPFFTTIFSEMEKTISYFKEQYPKEEIKAAIICGGIAKLPGLVMTIAKNLGLDTQISNPFVNLIVDPKILPSLITNAAVYTVTVGLALKDTE